MRGTNRVELTAAMTGLVLPSVLAQRAAQHLTRLVDRNRLRPPGAKAIGTVSASFAVGKSTFVKDWAQAAYRDLLGPACADPRPTWNPEPGVTADWIPHVYITLRAASKIRDVLAALLLTMGYPSEGLVRVTTTRVIHAFRQHGVRLLLIDDSHFLDVSNKDSRDMLDFLKYLNTELGELGGTMILVGADLHESPLYLDPQINSRLERLTLSAYPLATEDDRRTWQRFLKERRDGAAALIRLRTARDLLPPARRLHLAPHPGLRRRHRPAPHRGPAGRLRRRLGNDHHRPPRRRPPVRPRDGRRGRAARGRAPAVPATARQGPRVMTVLPVRPAPRPTEPLSSYAARLADANGIHRGRILPRYRHDIDIPKSELDTVATLAGFDDAAVRQLTMNRYPLAIRGHGIQRRHGWRLHFDVVWLCPACTLTTGHTDLLWQTALMPVCLRCRCYLVQAGTAHTVAPANPRVRELAEILRDLAEDAIDQPRARGILYRLRRRCQALAGTLDPGLPDANPDLPTVDLAAARMWGAYPPPDPCTVAALLVLCGRRLVRDKRQRPAHSRLHQSAEFTPADRARLDWFLTRLRHHAATDGLHPRHVPALLPLPAADDIPARRPGQWLSLTRAATALHMLITRAHDSDPTPEASTAALVVTGIPTSLLIDGIHTGAGLRLQDADLLSRSLDALLAAGLVDYQRRRDTLRAVTHLPSSATRLLPPTLAKTDIHVLALGWIWTRFTHGPMRSSPWPHIPDRDIHAFDTRIDPETRLLLHETGQQLLADADLLTIPTNRATDVGVTRRYG
ncbi:MAG: TniQ family protein [Actinobacteria bacterium]|nr:TniQ family protein [Actinomycetota bacterium]